MWDLLCQASKACTKGRDVSALKGLIISAPWKHIIPLDANGEPLCRSITWMDARAGKQAEQLNKRMNSFVGTGQEYWPRLMWLKEQEPEIWKKAKHIVGLNTYFKYRATGTLTTECTDNFITTPSSSLQEEYNRIICCAGLEDDLDKFPQLVTSTTCVGRLESSAAAQMGIEEGVPVFAGFTDLAAISIGSGCVREGCTHIYLGTSSWFGEIQRNRIKGYSNLYFTQDEQFESALFSIQTGGRAYDWLIGQFYHSEKISRGQKIIEFVDSEVAQVPAGSLGLIATHWLNGELAPLAKNAKAVFFNITEQHDRRYFARAMLESICYTHRWSLEKFHSVHGRLPDEISVVGGGAQSDVWMQMLADIIQIPVRVPKNPRYVGTIGSCYCAMIGLGLIENYSIAEKKVEAGRLFTPIEDNKTIYNKQFNLYKALYPALKPLYEQANGLI
jgi:xylulokinase